MTNAAPILAIINPIAGRGRARRAAERLAAAITASGRTVVTETTRSAGDLERRAAGWMQAHQPERVVLCGGDGTLHEFIQVIATQRLATPWTVLPCGTGNSLATEIHQPRSPAAIARVLLDSAAHTIEIPIARVTCGAASRYFVLFAGIGLDAAAVAVLCRNRRGALRSGRLAWATALLEVIRRRERRSFEARVADILLRDLEQLLVTRARRYGGILRLLPDSDGLFLDPGSGLVTLSGRIGSWVRAAKLALAAATGRSLPGFTLSEKVDSITVVSPSEPAQPIHLDGTIWPEGSSTRTLTIRGDVYRTELLCAATQDTRVSFGR